MKNLLAAFAILTLAACGEEAPTTTTTAVEPLPAPSAPAPQAAAPQAKASAANPEAPTPDPNQELAGRVKKALYADGSVLAEAIDVTASRGKVTLWGTTTTDAERKLAASIATKVEGVKTVDNQLKVVKGS